MSRIAIAAIVMLCLEVFPIAVDAQDSPQEKNSWHNVTVRQDGKWVTLRGTVREVKGATLLFQSTSGLQLQTFDFRAIKDFTFTANPDFVRGINEFQARNYRSAEQQFQRALTSETRDWAKAEILAKQALALIFDGKRNESIPLFQVIHQLDPASRLLGLLPLVWDKSLPEDEKLTLAPNRLSTGDDILKLAVASCVLADPEYQLRAGRVLGKIRAASKSPILAQLASAQLWRLSLITDTDSSPMLPDAWQSQWDRMPAPVRPGPGLILGRCLQHQHLYDRAALVFLWSPLVQINDPVVAASSLKQSVNCLNAAGRHDEAEVVFRELKLRFPGCSAAK